MPEVKLVSSLEGPEEVPPVVHAVVRVALGGFTARGIAGSRLVVVRGASHFAHYEKPGPVTDALLSHFLATANSG